MEIEAEVLIAFQLESGVVSNALKLVLLDVSVNTVLHHHVRFAFLVVQ